MPTPTAIHTRTMKAGTCPHGLPLGACPICNGMAGGNSTTKRDVPRNVGEMTYNQCAAIGAMLKAQKHAKEQAKIAQQNHLQALIEFSKNLANTHQRLANLKVLIAQNIPPIISKPINIVITIIQKLIFPLPGRVGFIQFVIHKFADISDKLTAIYGELKAAIKDKTQKFISDIKKKLKSMFFVFGVDETDDEEKKIDEAKKIFDLKTMLKALLSPHPNLPHPGKETIMNSPHPNPGREIPKLEEDNDAH